MQAFARSKLRSLTAASTSTSTTITAFTCASRASCARFPVPLALEPPRERRHTPSGPTCAEPVQSVVRAAFEKRDGTSVACRCRDLLCWEAGGLSCGAAGRCGAMRCGAVRAVQDEEARAAGTHHGNMYMYMYICLFFNNPDAGCWASQPREAGRAKGGVELKAVWSWFWSEERSGAGAAEAGALRRGKPHARLNLLSCPAGQSEGRLARAGNKSW